MRMLRSRLEIDAERMGLKGGGKSAKVGQEWEHAVMELC